ncbi:ribonuclease D [Candidatus Finniella inopinata]|uniref:Ribonuclease D n=1 Tax=Candidatus Finniella inopinata TaxID=1696036 RepID=A0A4Q7DLJ0_9PROT|nr:ribonuclease H-like domain-containing protein [Candidatus Finniella inopinata]RZI47125.1 ribonuclease D [Candidatus Finniella inopinata]
MKINLHTYDLPSDVTFTNSVAIDTEAMGLKNHRDRLCVVQLSAGDGECHLVHFPEPHFDQSPNLKRVLADKNLVKIFHYARFDVAILKHTFQIPLENIYCTKIASRLVRTYTNRHGLKDLCKELLGVELSKQEQTSDWGSEVLTQEQLKYAATDVLHLHKLKAKLDAMLEREKRQSLAQACFNFLPHRTDMDLTAGENFDIFSYQTDDKS